MSVTLPQLTIHKHERIGSLQQLRSKSSRSCKFAKIQFEEALSDPMGQFTRQQTIKVTSKTNSWINDVSLRSGKSRFMRYNNMYKLIIDDNKVGSCPTTCKVRSCPTTCKAGSCPTTYKVGSCPTTYKFIPLDADKCNKGVNYSTR